VFLDGAAAQRTCAQGAAAPRHCAQGAAVVNRAATDATDATDAAGEHPASNGEPAGSYQALLAALRERLRRSAAGGGGEALRARHVARCKPPVRERIEMLLEMGSPFLELSPLACCGRYDDKVQVASVITGFGRVAGADTIHPGCGFLSEKTALIDACAAWGIAFVGPHRGAILRMGSKIESKRIARAARRPHRPCRGPGRRQGRAARRDPGAGARVSPPPRPRGRRSRGQRRPRHPRGAQPVTGSRGGEAAGAHASSASASTSTR
jgi:hypothetical protein